MAQAARIQRELEALRHDSDHGVGTPIEIDRLAHYAWISLELLSPKRIANHRHRRSICIFFWCECAAQKWIDPKNGKYRSAHSFCRGMEWRTRPGHIVAGRNIPAFPGESFAFALEDQNVMRRHVQLMRIFANPFMQ